jgi:ABC-type glutathione transport system ATPase component
MTRCLIRCVGELFVGHAFHVPPYLKSTSVTKPICLIGGSVFSLAISKPPYEECSLKKLPFSNSSNTYRGTAHSSASPGSNGVQTLALEQVTKRFTTPGGERYTAIQDITLDIAGGVFLSVVGPSGCGKSTLLNLAAGLYAPSEGTIEIYGQRLSGLNRRASYMFQQDALLPWKTVLDNITAPAG